ncbi:MAG: helix-turn-helix domain-containing protein [Solirubrobacterales bacterium]|nr:helix-turn-helix domain-containing protein [Solirubrobacterales bacterium]
MADIGSTLREARMRARIDVSEVETRTKIRAKYLRAIENEEWDLLPGEIYVKSFLRTYGDYLGLDSRLLVDEFKRRYEAPPDHELRQMTPLGRERERPPRGPLIPPWVAIGLVLVAVVVALYIVGNSNKPSSPRPAARAPAIRRHQSPPRSVTTTQPATGGTVSLQLVPTGQVYVCLVDGTGKRLISGHIFGPGDTIPTKTAPKLLLTLGNASVKMTVNGSAVAVTPSADSIGFLLQPGGNSSLPPSKQPRCA